MFSLPQYSNSCTQPTGTKGRALVTEMLLISFYVEVHGYFNNEKNKMDFNE